VKNPSGVNRGIASLKVDGVLVPGNLIPDQSDGQIHHVEVIMG
jgi:cellobiose phosphorylase